MSTRASPKSHWAWPGGWDSGTNISLRLTAILSDVVLDRWCTGRQTRTRPCSRSKMRLAVWRCFLSTPEVVLQDAVDDARKGL